MGLEIESAKNLKALLITTRVSPLTKLTLCGIKIFKFGAVTVEDLLTAQWDMRD